MPRLWDQSIDAHRDAVRRAIMDAAWRLAEERGPMAVTMSQVAAASGIGRATLYKYFPDVEAVLVARHAAHVADHLASLAKLREQGATPGDRLQAVLTGYARICFHRGQHGSDEIGALVHRGPEVVAAERSLLELFGGVIRDAAADGYLSADAAAPELAVYCLHALGAAAQLRSAAAVGRLVDRVLRGLGVEVGSRTS